MSFDPQQVFVVGGNLSVSGNVTPTANSTVQVTNNVTTTIQANATVAVTSVPANQTVSVTSMPANITANITAIVANQTVVVNGNTSVVGPVAANVTVAGNPVQAAYRALSAEAVPNGNNTVILPATDLVGKTITSPYANKENMLRGNATIANTTAVAIVGMGAQGANLKVYITSVQAFRTDAGTTLVYLTLNDTGNTTIPLPPNGGAGFNYPVPLVLAANVSANVTLSANITSALISAQGYFGT